MTFLLPAFAIAGLVAAAGPIIIHLLNRRRFRVVEWAAMDFLREAVTRSRRILQLRDLLLLALRTLAILLFGAAMARPFLEKDAGPLDPDQPVHAVVMIDNSLSMAYQAFDQSVLVQAKAQAVELIKNLPQGSRISVLPTCGSEAGFSYTAYYSPEDALEALETINPVDRSTRADETIDLALDACARVPTMPAKQIVLFTDRQVADWPLASLETHLAQLPARLQIVEVEAPEPENAWISDFRLQDGVADLRSPAVFVATISYEGAFPRSLVPITLTVDGVTIAQQVVDLQPGQQREVAFPPFTFNVAAEPGTATFATAEVSLPQDKLPADDQRFLVVPVVATLPVVFVDQFGEQEDPRQNRFGETLPWRRLLSPLLAETDRRRQFIEERHVTIDQLDREMLQDARLVAIAGVASPGNAVPLLREYVEQGGNLVVAAGGLFDPELWNDEAWQDGMGILPAPLSPITVGRTPEESPGQVEFFQFDFDSLVHDYFLLEGESNQSLKDLYALPFFFKTVDAQVDDAVLEKMVENVTKAAAQRQAELARLDTRLEELRELQLQRDLTPAEQAELSSLGQQRAGFEPDWLLWESPRQQPQDELPPEEIARRSRPQVLARFTNGLPMLVARRLGHGQVLLATSGVSAGWNTMQTTDAMLVFDRIFRDLLRQTIPPRNLATHEDLIVPVAAAGRSAEYTLTTPDGYTETLSVEAVGSDRFGVRVGRRARRGIFQLAAHQKGRSESGVLETRLLDIPLAFNGPADESQLLSQDEIRRRQGRGRDASEQTTDVSDVGLARASLHGTDLWKWCMAAVLAVLLVELILLAWSAAGRERTA